MSEKSRSLYFKEGSSDKEYHAQLVKSGSGFVVNFQYGRRGSALKSESKTPSPVSLGEAEKIFDKLIKSKLAKGYSSSETGKIFSDGSGLIRQGEVYGFSPQLLNMIEEEDLLRLIEDEDFLAQEKFDGERRMLEKTNQKLVGVNKKGMLVDVPSALEKAIPGDMVLDGEMVGDVFFAFDLLKLKGKDLKTLPLEDRLKMLAQVKFKKGITVAKSASSAVDKAQLLKSLKDENAEGIVFKKKTAAYSSGRPASGGSALKFKFHKTATVLVTGQSPSKRSVEISVYNGKKLVPVGKVTVPINKTIPSKGSFIEVRYLYAYRGGALFQPVLLNERSDVDEADASINQLVYKAE